MEYKVYLAGPIKGFTHGDSVGWRDRTIEMLPTNIICYSPMRKKEYLDGCGIISGTYEDLGLFASQSGIMTRDYFDVQRADALFVYLLDSTAISVGTVMEIAWAYQMQKPIITVMDDQNIHNHPMLNFATPVRTDTLEKGVEALKHLLLPG